MLLGLLARRHLPAVADKLWKPVAVAANLALLVLAVLVLIVAIPIIRRFGIAAIAAVVAFVAVAVLVGHLLGGPGRGTLVTLAAILATRFPVPALELAEANGATKTILPVVLVYILAGMLLVPLYDWLMASCGNRCAKSTSSSFDRSGKIADEMGERLGVLVRREVTARQTYDRKALFA